MAVQKVSNHLIYCLAADTKPTTMANNTLAYVVDTGDVYKSTGGAWALITDGPSTAVTLSNKTLGYTTNTLDGWLEHTRNKRNSYSYVTNATMGWIGFMGGLNITGTATRVIDATGLHVDFATGTSSNTRVGRASTAAEAGTSRLSYLPAIYCKFAAPIASAHRFYFGWSNATTLPASDTPLANGDHGIGLGWISTDTNFQTFNNDGSGAAVKANYTGPIALDTAVHTASIVATTSSSVTITLDSNTPVVITTRLPLSTVNLIPFCTLQNSTITTKTLSLYYIEGVQTL